MEITSDLPNLVGIKKIEKFKILTFYTLLF